MSKRKVSSTKSDTEVIFEVQSVVAEEFGSYVLYDGNLECYGTKNTSYKNFLRKMQTPQLLMRKIILTPKLMRKELL